VPVTLVAIILLSPNLNPPLSVEIYIHTARTKVTKLITTSEKRPNSTALETLPYAAILTS